MWPRRGPGHGRHARVVMSRATVRDGQQQVLKTALGRADTRLVGVCTRRGNRSRHRWSSRVRSDSGFTLVEAVVALAIATVMFTALAYATIGAIRATQSARANQQAIDVANQQIEAVRQKPWGELSGLVKDDGTAAIPATTVESNGVDYSVTTYITTPTGSTGELNVRSVVNWDLYGDTKERVAETSVTQKSAGLPRPDFELRSTSPLDITIAPGSSAAWGIRLVNRGAWDSWSLDGNPGGLKFYPDRTSASDATPDGKYDPAIDKDPTTGGTITGTGQIDPYDSFNFWAVATETSAGPVKTWTITATSSVQPEAASASETIDISLTVAEPNPTATSTSVGTCAPSSSVSEPTASGNGYSQVSYYLHNSGKTPWPASPGVYSNTAAASPLDMTTQEGVVPLADALPEFATDVDTVAGRPVATGGSLSSTWAALPLSQSLTFQMLDDQTWYEKVQLRAFVRNTTSDEDFTVQAQLFSVTSSGTDTYSVVKTSSAIDVAQCSTPANYREVVVDLSPASILKLAKSQYLGVRLINTSGTGDTISFAYDHKGVPARLVVVEK